MLVAAVSWTAISSNNADAKDLGIGSKAPAIDVEHWLEVGKKEAAKVTTFDEGKIYVIEFWATWCGPCIGSMPHLAELQNEYRDQGVRIVSISDETIDEVKDLLGKEHPDSGKTFAEVTSAYSLTTDPDRSVYEDYMEASDQQGIPTAFIVGKTGLIEWIGHPGNMDEPLEAVVKDSWDREAFKLELKAQEELQENMVKVDELASEGKFDEAIKFTETQIESAANEMMKDHWGSIRHSLKLSSDKLDDETLAFYREQIGEMKGDLGGLIRFSYAIIGVAQDGRNIGPLASEAVKALEGESKDVAKEAQATYLSTIAMLHMADGKGDAAIATMEKAVEAADVRQKRRLTPMLEEFKKIKADEESK
ncbi:Thiol-disulfide oxidoreductase ResA [Rubripirellula tenax]|uniref:Thiol-disulfide oxidoreductase ResA n=2 Tax=Rubripirellula tenax TaxID=2528015 RepID=A0A5C6FKV0_9BACT|nr:Thiol-disulfide oxidoreductase ResA [Rubripirellula tenax]